MFNVCRLIDDVIARQPQVTVRPAFGDIDGQLSTPSSCRRPAIAHRPTPISSEMRSCDENESRPGPPGCGAQDLVALPYTSVVRGMYVADMRRPTASQLKDNLIPWRAISRSSLILLQLLVPRRLLGVDVKWRIRTQVLRLTIFFKTYSSAFQYRSLVHGKLRKRVKFNIVARCSYQSQEHCILRMLIYLLYFKTLSIASVGQKFRHFSPEDLLWLSHFVPRFRI